MATVDKSFRIKNGLTVEGSSATVNGSTILTEASTEFLQDTVGAMVTGSTQTNITVTYDDATGKLNFVAENGVADSTTDNLVEGSTNKYFTDERAQDAIGNFLGSGLSYNDATGAIGIDTSVTTNSGTQTLTNKTIALGSNTVSGTLAQFNTAVTDADLASLAGTETLTNKTISLGNNTVSGTLAEFNTAVTDADLASLAGAETLTNKTISGANNTLTNIPNSALSNSSITINGFSISLGGSATYGTDNINEGSTNLYFTDERAQDAVGNVVGNGLDYDDATGAISVDPSEFTLNSVGAPTADVTMASYKITNLATPTSANDAANKAYVDNVTAGLNFHAAVHAATTANLAGTYNNGTSGVGATLTASSNGALVVDGHTMIVDERILVKNQSTASQNGIYTVTATGDGSNPWVLTRATDADNSPSGEVAYGDFCFVQDGATNGGYGFILTTTGTVTIGTTALSFTQFNAGQSVIAGNGLTEPTPGTIAIDTSVTANLSGAQTLTNKTITLGTNTVSGTLAQFNTAVTDADLASLAGTETLTNKTIALGSNTVSGTLTQFNTAVTDADLASLAGTETLTNKTIALESNTVSGTLAQFNTAVTDADLASLAGAETLTNKTISGTSNTLTNIANSSLTNSSVTVGTTSIALGASSTTLAGLTNVALTNAAINSASVTATTSGVATTIDSFAVASYTTAKYLIQMSNGAGDREVTEVLITVDSSNNVYLTEYATIMTNADLGSISAVFSGGNVNVQITPTANNIDVKASRTLIAA